MQHDPENSLDEKEVPAGNVIPLTDFIGEFRDGLLDNLKLNTPPVYDGSHDPLRDQVLDMLIRQPFYQQRERVHAVANLLLDCNERAAVINGEMGTGKTMMGICAAEILHSEGYPRCLVICPPHLVYKWRREIQQTVANARVWILNGPDTLAKLISLKAGLSQNAQGPEYFIMGRVRMRMGFTWKPMFNTRSASFMDAEVADGLSKHRVCSCPKCGTVVVNDDNEPIFEASFPTEKRVNCKACDEPLWSLIRPNNKALDKDKVLKDNLCKLPTIGPKTAGSLIHKFGRKALVEMLEDNVHEFINLLDADGELVFSDRQANRFERSIANTEFSFGAGGYQPTEFIKRYLPTGYFGSLIVDEGHEYKNEGSAQGQAMGVLSMKCQKVILLTGTLMGGYADDLFHLLWRILPQKMIEDGYAYNRRGSIASAVTGFMRKHGVLQDVFKEEDGGNHKTARGKRTTVRTRKAPGFSPQGVIRYVLPYTVFLKLSDLDQNVLPSYEEQFLDVEMTADQKAQYQKLSATLLLALRQALAKGDRTLLGLVLTVLLAWPDCCFRPETVRHPRDRSVLTSAKPMFVDQPTPKEQKLIALCKAEQSAGRKVLVYTIYTGKRDTASRLKLMLENQGLKVAVMRSSVGTDKREDWICDQVDRGIDVLVCNPELVKTGLDLLEFPTIVFMQSGYNVYTVQQASRRSWRIGQTEAVKVFFLGYQSTAQIDCLELMSRKIQVSQSTSGEIPETGLDVLSAEDESLEVELAKQLLAA